MKKAFKGISLALSMIVVLSACGGNGNSNTTNANTTPANTDTSASEPANTASTDNQSGEDASANKLKEFSLWTWLGSVESWGGKSYDEVLAYQELEKRSGVKVKYVHPTGDAVESFNLMMTSGEMTDAIWYRWNPERMKQYSDAGRIIDIYPLVKEHAPNLMALMESDASLKKQLVDPEGHMYYMPWITQDKFLGFGEGLVLREDWLNKAGMGVPKTNDELYNTLKAMKDKKVSGTKPFVGLTGYASQIYKLFYGFGVADDWFVDNGKVVYGPTSDRYKEALKWFNKLYKEGLLDKDYLTGETDIYNKHIADGQAAGLIDNTDAEGTAAKMAADAGNPFKFVGIPYMQYNGKSVSLNSTAKRVAQPYGLAITSTAKDPAGIVAYLDYGFSDEGKTLFNWGIEGDTFEVKDGKKVYTDKIMKAADNVPGVEMTKYVNPWWITVTDADSAKALLDADGLKTRETWADVDTSMAFEPTLFMTPDESEVMSSASTDIATFKDSMRDGFITGAKNIDSEWDGYVKTLNGMGIENVQKVQQSAYDRFAATK
ncbi:carbohydrate ABC transporter substrate-binding protein (CUT1 family) [Paenibacillus taihuensis]|uniref:Carbohydrate ABC transporter substrate-binding protein (CUT1 family) n=1 Tax=Paenibacillus taihuensis TaxID=1156355 RepID=A0A3D9Q3W7_9BACL|nr:hypothetical protein [Paenibacillus taihuensis]REE57573.1 carbohydrate ABC transporter substrate-binding protein (CUT1 family) [Paenibacillus taihuensis]